MSSRKRRTVAPAKRQEDDARVERDRQRAREEARRLRDAMGSRYIMAMPEENFEGLAETLGINEHAAHPTAGDEPPVPLFSDDPNADVDTEQAESRDWVIQQMRGRLSLLMAIVNFYGFKKYGRPIPFFGETPASGDPIDPNHRPEFRLSKLRFHVDHGM